MKTENTEVNQLVRIWQKYVPGERFGQFLVNALCMSPEAHRSDAHLLNALEQVTATDLLEGARLRVSLVKVHAKAKPE